MDKRKSRRSNSLNSFHNSDISLNRNVRKSSINLELLNDLISKRTAAISTIKSGSSTCVSETQDETNKICHDDKTYTRYSLLDKYRVKSSKGRVNVAESISNERYDQIPTLSNDVQPLLSTRRRSKSAFPQLNTDAKSDVTDKILKRNIPEQYKNIFLNSAVSSQYRAGQLRVKQMQAETQFARKPRKGIPTHCANRAVQRTPLLKLRNHLDKMANEQSTSDRLEIDEQLKVSGVPRRMSTVW